ncbi:hypothetical protein SAMN05660826_01944 [Caldanaerovirga acetigignens]|uniref:Uncharacterized protein n=1 Tax=Caldanaerovirga acetigignens TaxID=447595 RepID=A0A1M7LKI8_9FIRM|nr:hypothetical protein [Caldanaerovirga acetigignens]SHM78165.1 hypothetical protein SAMN05660826_01944 [Caldanaerovirga acetigignens]
MIEGDILYCEDIVDFLRKLTDSEKKYFCQKDMAEIYADLIKEIMWVDIYRK